MIDVGIDAISFYIPVYFFSMNDLAKARNIPGEKLSVGIGQIAMSFAPPDEDVVTMGASAAYNLTNFVDFSEIDTLFFATESGVDQSKSSGVFVHKLLGLNTDCRVVELKQACYSSTAALRMAVTYVKAYPDKKVLVIASDISRYALNSNAEPTQGSGACAMIISANPRILAVDDFAGLYTEDIMDFWRPHYTEEAFVDGKFSAASYLKALGQCWNSYIKQSGRKFQDFYTICYHTPIARLAEKAHKSLSSEYEKLSDDDIKIKLMSNLYYPKRIGNSYTAALFISFISLLDNDICDLSDKLIGFYGYGSGCVAEFFSGRISKNYMQCSLAEKHQNMITQRKSLTIEKYEQFHKFRLPEDGSEFYISVTDVKKFRLAGIKNHKRIYEKLL